MPAYCLAGMCDRNSHGTKISAYSPGIVSGVPIPEYICQKMYTLRWSKHVIEVTGSKPSGAEAPHLSCPQSARLEAVPFPVRCSPRFLCLSGPCRFQFV